MQVKITVIRGTWVPFACGTGSTLPDDRRSFTPRQRGCGRARLVRCGARRQRRRQEIGFQQLDQRPGIRAAGLSWVRHISQASLCSTCAACGSRDRIEAEIQKVDPQRLRLRLPVEARAQPPASAWGSRAPRRPVRRSGRGARRPMSGRGGTASTQLGRRAALRRRKAERRVPVLRLAERTAEAMPHGGRMREPQQFVTQLRDGSGAIVRPVHSRCATPRRCVRSS